MLPWASGREPQGQGRPGLWASPELVSTRFFQMYQKEKQVLQELNKHMGTRLQPLSRGLF